MEFKNCSEYYLRFNYLLDLYEINRPEQILGLLIFCGIPLILLFEFYLRRRGKTKHVNVIFGIISIILGSVILIIAIWAQISWKEPTYPVLGPDYRWLFPLVIVICIILVGRGMIFINRRKYVDRNTQNPL
ncbi:MAG: hypothetical protein ACFFE4_10955 [Candidatus Thorarchaeota archaeon]